ncbi:hypothetical protein PVAND_016564 [Polypedilum vanderplanki]|uniref:Peptidase S1 domain-containing protein n=1 Tax=Polypedilum vanderplanki TaxID=319348 RepID=A0A9J6BFS8_POLVA|nr:hypothetical protein PVAND_016564 [Polypedilum vanderplanki]
MNRRIFLIFSFAIVNSSTTVYFKSTEQLKLSIFSIKKHDAKLSSISNPKTINGHPVKLGEISYHVLIFLTFENSPENIFYCSGSIISENWIITAAKCTFNVRNVRNVTIYLGVIDRLHGSTLWNAEVYKTSI